MQLSFGMVFRIWTMAAFLIGWLVLTQRALPETVFLGVMCSGIVLSWAVGLRRLGSLWARVWASVSFVLCTLSVAFYSALFAAWQKPRMANFNIGAILICLTPLTILSLVSLLKSWTWSAHDHQRRRER